MQKNIKRDELATDLDDGLVVILHLILHLLHLVDGLVERQQLLTHLLLLQHAQGHVSLHMSLHNTQLTHVGSLLQLVFHGAIK